MKLNVGGILLGGLLLSGCVVAQSKLDDATTTSAVLKNEARSQDQELSKSNKKVQELEAKNKNLNIELNMVKKQLAAKENEVEENRVWMEELIKQMKSIP